MKKIIIAVCVVLCGLTSCVDEQKVHNCISLHYEFEQKIKNYERLDSMTMDDVRNDAYQQAEDARTAYLRAFARLNDDERKYYHKLEAECKKADEEYLGSIYADEEDSSEQKSEFKKLESYGRYMQ